MDGRVHGEGPDAVLLAGMGGPRHLGEVRPFLREIFLDPAIVGAPAIVRRPLAHLIALLRAPIARRRYALIGGRSPLPDEMAAQALALARTLHERGRRGRVAWGMRYGEPSLARALDALAARGLERLVLIPAFPQYSATTCGSVIERVRGLWDAAGRAPDRLRIVGSFPTLPGLVAAWVDRIRAALAELPARGAWLLFTAHSVPMARIAAGDPYREEVRATVEAILAALPDPPPHALGYQSRLGPVRWLGPRIGEVLRASAGAGMAAAAVVPVSFVAENLETRYDLEIVLRTEAGDIGVTPLSIARTPGDHPAFIEGLAGEVERALSG